VNTAHRIAELRRLMEARGIALSLVMNPDNQQYITGFKALIYSRPIVLAISPEKTTLVVPGLEEVHAKHEAKVDELLVYYEHPELADRGKTHLDHLGKIAGRLPRDSKVGVEMGFCPAAMVEYLRSQGLEPVDVGQKIKEMRFIKDEAEMQLMLEAGRLTSLECRAALGAIKPGVTEMEIDAAGSEAVFEEVSARHPGATLDILGMTPSGLERTVMPHVFSNTRRLQTGDILIHSRQVALNGYRGECERTAFLGRPSAEQERAFKVMEEAQQAALEAFKVGVPMKDVDWAARRIIQKAGFGDYAIHRTGHAIGLSAHEEPYLRFDEEMVLQEGMAFSIEPGFYVPGLGGFRHSDTVLLWHGRSQMTTDYPRELESLIL